MSWKKRRQGEKELALAFLAQLREMTAPLDDDAEDDRRVYAWLLDRVESLLNKGRLERARDFLPLVWMPLREDSGDKEFIQMLKRMSETPLDAMGES